MTDASLLAKLASPTGRAAQLVKSKLNPDEMVSELFLAALGREPNDKEKTKALEHLSDGKDAAAIADLLWALINTREFILNH